MFDFFHEQFISAFLASVLNACDLCGCRLENDDVLNHKSTNCGDNFFFFYVFFQV